MPDFAGTISFDEYCFRFGRRYQMELNRRKRTGALSAAIALAVVVALAASMLWYVRRRVRLQWCAEAGHSHIQTGRGPYNLQSSHVETGPVRAHFGGKRKAGKGARSHQAELWCRPLLPLSRSRRLFPGRSASDCNWRRNVKP